MAAFERFKRWNYYEGIIMAAAKKKKIPPAKPSPLALVVAARMLALRAHRNRQQP
jgi:hypothetical protein